MVIIRIYYKFLKGEMGIVMTQSSTIRGEICEQNLINSKGLLNIINIITGASAWRCNKHAFTTLAWLPLFYIEMTRGRPYTLLLILQLIATSFAMPQLTFAYEGYDQESIVKQLSNCCSSYTYNYIMGAFYMLIVFEIYRNADTKRPWISLLVFGTLLNALSMTMDYTRHNPSRHIGGLVVSIYVILLCATALILNIKNMKVNKYMLPFLAFLVYLAVFLYTAYEDRTFYHYENTNTHTKAPIVGRHAGVLLFAGVFVILTELLINPPNVKLSRFIPTRFTKIKE